MSLLVSPAIAASEETDPRVEKLAEFEPVEAEVGEIYQQDKVDRYIVLLEGDSLVTYEGEIPGLRAANPHTPGEKLDVASEASVMYLDYLRGQQNGQIERIETAIRRDLEVDFRYDVILNGFAAKMTAAEAKRLGKMEEVKAVYKDELWQINTDVSPGFIGADQLWTDTASTPGTLGTKGEGMIVGILDTGINMDHPSFADVGGDDYDHENPFGSGNYVGLCYSDPTNYICNDKLIGVYGYTEGDEAFTGEDGHAHGSHTASTAAGNYLELDYNGIPVTISGMAPHANIIAYDVCDPDGCANAYSTEAVQQAVIDGVDVINYSIGPNSAVNPYENAVEMAMLEAIDAGILTSTSAGNSGPEPSTVFKAPAWSLIVANSTHGRIFGYTVEVHEPGGAELYEAVALPGVGVPFTSDLVDMPIRWSGDDGNLEGCTAFSADFFAGSVALISRGS
jgi:subtilisin family serine protease